MSSRAGISQAPLRWAPVLRLCRFLALLLAANAFVVGSSALAAPPAQGSVTTLFGLHVQPRSGPICVGRSYKFSVYSIMARTLADGGTTVDTLFGTQVKASVINTDIGTVSPPQTYTGAGQSPVIDLVTGIPPAPSSAVFTFQALKTGETRLVFQGLVLRAPDTGVDQAVDASLPIKVVNCNFHVTVSSIGNLNLGAPIIYIVGSESEADLRPSADAEDVLTGTDDSFWWSAVSFPRCQVSISYGYTQAGYRGTLSSNGTELHLQVGYQRVQLISSVACPLVGGVGEGANSPAPVEIRVSTDGGTVTMPDPGGGFPLVGFPMHGSSTVTVVPIPAN